MADTPASPEGFQALAAEAGEAGLVAGNKLLIHLEPKDPIELDGMLRELGSLQRLYKEHTDATRPDAPRKIDETLYVSSIQPGSIDITLMSDIWTVAEQGAAVAATSGVTGKIGGALDFAKNLKSLLGKFDEAPDPSTVSIRDCDDAVAIAGPIAKSGGKQDFIVNNNTGVQVFQFSVSSEKASDVISNALETKASLKLPAMERHTAVPLVWHRIENSDARTAGKTSPDQGIISEIDEKPRAVFFNVDDASIKDELLADRMMQKVYFVDVEVSRIEGKVVSYRVVGYHGSQLLD